MKRVLLVESRIGGQILVPDPAGDKVELGEELDIRSYWLNCRSQYLLARNWIQASLLGNPDRSSLEKLLHVLRTVGSRQGGKKRADFPASNIAP
jgi:hypothetical protein